ncbi:MAG: hypothetical protein ABI743_04605 [bacterium]
MCLVRSWTVLPLALVTLGCAGGPGSAPVIPPVGASTYQPMHVPVAGYAPGGTAMPSGTVSDGLLQESALGVWTLHLDPTTLSATVTPAAMRHGQENDDLYELPLDNLVHPGSFTVLEVKADADSVDVTWQFTHPFAAPADVSLPATAANRADLGISGRVLMLADVTSATGNTFYQGSAEDGTIILNPTLAQNPDGYLRPNALVDLAGFTANTFPYQALVDERGNGNRAGLSTGGNPQGNYDPTNGWQREDFGPTRNGFTGYGILHQGQTVTRVARFNLAALQAGQSIDLGVAILAKYVDPRGGATLPEKKANRLPGATADVMKFCYREPHGSLDIEALRFQGQNGTVSVNSTGSAEFRFTVADWDARASVTAQTNLANEPVSSKVAIGAAGPPTLSVCVPGVLGTAATVIDFAPTALKDDDTPIGGDAGQDSGRPGDGLYYSQSLQNAGTGQTRGIYYGVARAIDPEDLVSFATPRVFLDANLLPLSTNLPRVRTYQVFPFTIGNNPPTLEVELDDNIINSGTVSGIAVVSAVDVEDDPLTVEIDWDGDNTYEVSRTLLPGETPLWVSPLPYNNPTASNMPVTIHVRYTDGFETAISHPNLMLSVGPNRPPVVSAPNVFLVNPTLAPPAQFVVDALNLDASDPEGDPITYVITNSVNSDQVSGPGFPIPAHLNPFPAGTPDPTFSLYATDTLHPAGSGAAFATVTGTIVLAGWARRFGAQGYEEVHAIAAQGDNVYIAATYFNYATDFGQGPLPSTGGYDMAVIALDSQGTYRWAHLFGNGQTNGNFIHDLAIADNGDLFVAGEVDGPTDFGGGSLATPAGLTRAFLLHYLPDGTLQESGFLSTGGMHNEYSFGVTTTPDNAVVVCGSWVGDTINFGGADHVSPGKGLYGGYVLKLNQVMFGTVWERAYNEPGGSVQLVDLDHDSAGNLYLAGLVTGDADFGGGPSGSMPPAGVRFKLLSGGTWQFEGITAHAFPHSIAVHENPDLLLTGGHYDADVNFGAGTRTYLGGGRDAYVAAYNLDGFLTWDRELSTSFSEEVAAVALDPAGDCLVAGLFRSALDFGGGARMTAFETGFCAKYSSFGSVYLWDATFGTEQGGDCYAVATDANGGVYTGGNYVGPTDLQPGSGTSLFTTFPTDSGDSFVTRLQSATGEW